MDEVADAVDLPARERRRERRQPRGRRRMAAPLDASPSSDSGTWAWRSRERLLDAGYPARGLTARPAATASCSRAARPARARPSEALAALDVCVIVALRRRRVDDGSGGRHPRGRAARRHPGRDEHRSRSAASDAHRATAAAPPASTTCGRRSAATRASVRAGTAAIFVSGDGTSRRRVDAAPASDRADGPLRRRGRARPASSSWCCRC